MASRKVGAKITGCHTGVVFEHLREMALVREPGGQSYLAEGAAGVRDFAGRELDPESADVLADGASEMPAKERCQINRVNAHTVRYFLVGHVLAEPGMKKFASLVEPTRQLFLRRFRFHVSELRQNFEGKTFNR